MSTINNLLSGASSALNAHKSMMELIGKNIANANTPGYSRQRGLLTPGHPGMNVMLDSVNAVRSSTIQRSILGAEQGVGFQNGRMRALQLAEPALNDLDGAGVSAAMSDFFAAMNDLTSNPAGIGERENLLFNASSLASSIRTAADGITSARNAAESEAQAVVKKVNSLTKKVAALNKQISILQGTGQPVGEVVDQRDTLLKELAGQVEIQTLEGSDGTVSVFMGSGIALVDKDSAAGLELTGGGTDALTLTVVRTGGSKQTVGASVGGQLGGLMDARDVTLKSSLDQLDQVAFALATEMNQVHQTGFGLDGSTGNNFFEVGATAEGAASQIKLSSDVAGNPEKIAAAMDPTQVPGDNANLKAMIELLEGEIVPGGKTLTEGYDGAVSTVASALNDAVNRGEAEATRAASFEAARASESGVSLQEEMVSLTQAERAFQAATRVIETANELYDAVLRMV